MHIHASRHILVALLPAIALVAQPADAQVVGFTGAVVNLCVLTVSTPGLLGMAATGTTLSSEETGGLNAVVAVAATGSNPTIGFGAPALTGPAASIGGASRQIAYSSPGGANQAFTSGTSSYVSTRLIDTITVKAHATNSAGFTTGAYGISSTVTCQQ